MDLGLGFTEGSSPILDVQGVRISGGISQEKKNKPEEKSFCGCGRWHYLLFGSMTQTVLPPQH